MATGTMLICSIGAVEWLVLYWRLTFYFLERYTSMFATRMATRG